ncbi:MAG: biotin--[acetyl-CoA-carboxylase] ligase [Chloroflexota bacterium]|nr:biotin--[acetyl-CoA-carboxylase] ligase [Chloroflexota bacterium]
MRSAVKILNMLYGAEGYVSGEEMARGLGISRTAVWKQIQDLRGGDFIIEAKPRSGYRIISYPDKLLPLMVEKGLRTAAVGRKIYYYQSLDSTNLVARSFAEEGAPEGSLVLTEEQVNGKGRCGRDWVSPKGVNILASVILRPPIVPRQVPLMAVLGAVSVVESIRQVTGLEAKYRWPHEVVVGDKKVAGVLTEFGAELDRVNFVVLGLGINVNFDLTAFPGLASGATSLWMESKVKVSRVKLLQTLLERIESNYQLLKNNKFHLPWSLWSGSFWRLGTWVQAVSAGDKYSGVLKRMDDTGCLILAEVDGERMVPMSGDASLTTD